MRRALIFGSFCCGKLGNAQRARRGAGCGKIRRLCLSVIRILKFFQRNFSFTIDIRDNFESGFGHPRDWSCKQAQYPDVCIGQFIKPPLERVPGRPLGSAPACLYTSAYLVNASFQHFHQVDQLTFGHLVFDILIRSRQPQLRRPHARSRFSSSADQYTMSASILLTGLVTAIFSGSPGPVRANKNAGYSQAGNTAVIRALGTFRSAGAGYQTSCLSAQSRGEVSASSRYKRH